MQESPASTVLHLGTAASFSLTLKLKQGHSTTEGFQIRQKYLKWFSVRFGSPFGAALKTIYVF